MTRDEQRRALEWTTRQSLQAARELLEKRVCVECHTVTRLPGLTGFEQWRVEELARRVDLSVDAGSRIGVLGRNGAGKSTLIRLLAGSEMPDRGRVRRHARVSFPLRFGGTFHGTLSGRENVAFIARIYGAGVRYATRYVEEFAELDGYFDMPVNTYSAGMRARLAFGTCLAVDFDIYLIDEVTEIGDDRFRHKCAPRSATACSAPTSFW